MKFFSLLRDLRAQTRRDVLSQATDRRPLTQADMERLSDLQSMGEVSRRYKNLTSEYAGLRFRFMLYHRQQ
jgi:hypothetical protein